MISQQAAAVLQALATHGTLSTSAVMQAIGDRRVEVTRKKCQRLGHSGLLASKARGERQVIYEYTITALGSMELAKYTKAKGYIVLRVVGRLKRGSTSGSQYEHKPYAPPPPNLALPRTISVMAGDYKPSTDTYYRNDGNKHIKSLGFR